MRSFSFMFSVTSLLVKNENILTLWKKIQKLVGYALFLWNNISHAQMENFLKLNFLEGRDIHYKKQKWIWSNKISFADWTSFTYNVSQNYLNILLSLNKNINYNFSFLYNEYIRNIPFFLKISL